MARKKEELDFPVRDDTFAIISQEELRMFATFGKSTLKIRLYIWLKSQCFNKKQFGLPSETLPEQRLKTFAKSSQYARKGSQNYVRPGRIREIIEEFKKLQIIGEYSVSREFNIPYHILKPIKVDK